MDLCERINNNTRIHEAKKRERQMYNCCVVLTVDPMIFSSAGRCCCNHNNKTRLRTTACILIDHSRGKVMFSVVFVCLFTGVGSVSPGQPGKRSPLRKIWWEVPPVRPALPNIK